MKYNEYNKQATDNDTKHIAQIHKGDFIHTATANSKENDFTDWIGGHEFYNMGDHRRLCQIVDIVEVAEDEDLLGDWLGRKAPEHRGGSCSDDIPEGKHPGEMTKSDYATFFDLITVYRKPSGKWIGVDCQGYDYWRYVHLPHNYSELFASECKEARKVINERREKQEAEEEAELAAHREALDKRENELKERYSDMILNPKSGKQVSYNIRKFFKIHLPDLPIKVNVRRDYWGTSYDADVKAPANTSEAERLRVQSICDMWNETLPAGYMDDDGYGRYEPHIQPFNMFGNIKWELRVSYCL